MLYLFTATIMTAVHPAQPLIHYRWALSALSLGSNVIESVSRRRSVA